MTPLHGGKPGFYWSSRSLLGLSLCAPFAQEEGERCPNPVSRSIAPEQVANGGPRHAGLASLPQRAQNFVGNRIAERIPENVRSRSLAIFPNRQPSLEVRDLYASTVVE